MLYLKTIEAKNLFSWKNLDIGFQPSSAYSLKGENGTGKSSIFEIIIWVLFKKTTKKNVKGNYGKDEGHGKVTISDGKSDYVIERSTDTPMQILMNGKNITQEYLESFVGGNFSVFMASNMCSQKRVSAFVNESSDSGKAKIFGEMLGCTILDKIRVNVNKKKSEYQVSYESACAKVQSIEETIQSYTMDMEEETVQEYEEGLKDLQKHLEQVKEDSKLADEYYDKALKLNRSWDSYDKEIELIESQKSLLKIYEKDLEALEQNNSDVNLKELEDQKEALLQKYDKYLSEYNRVVADRRTFQSRLTELENILEIEGQCPTCGTKVTEKHRIHVKSEIQSLKNSISEKLSEAEKFKSKYKKYSEKVKGCSVKIKQASDAVSLQQIKLQRVNDTKEHIKTLKSNLRKPKKARRDAEGLLNRSRGLASKVAEIEKGIETRERVLKGYRKAYSHLESARISRDKKGKVYDVYSWLFKHIPLMKLRYINDNKVALEDIINEHISKMGIPFMVKIETEKQLKTTKELKEAFSFQIISTIRKNKADKKDLSGGEETCILLATQFGISDIAGTNLDFEIYDEIYGSLDNKNLAAVVEALQDRANSQNKQLFSISHKDEISHSFPNIITVEKKNGYSRTSR